jgi:putative transposase
MSRELIETGELYHIYNRGVEKRDVFLDDGDHLRFIHHLYHLNTQNKPPHLSSVLTNLSDANKEVGPPRFTRRAQSRDPLVDIIAYVLMPNHYHLLLSQRVDRGISQFMQRLGTGYTMFFNEKYERSGALFQGKYKYKKISTDRHFLYIPHYIHMNPIPLLHDARMKQGGPTSLFDKLVEYRWSSLRDYIGIRNFPSVITPTRIIDSYGGIHAYSDDLRSFVETKRKLPISDISDIAIDLEKKRI